LSAALAVDAPARHRVTARWVFWALLMRDVTVVRRELVFFLLRTTMQPLMFTLVFGFLLPRMGFVQRNYSSALLPGLLGISLAFAAVQSVALPMVADFGWTREIEDRLLAPVDNRLVALEKVVAASVQGIIAALFVLPVARLIMGPVEGLSVSHFGEVIAVVTFGAAAFSVIGLFLGTVIEGQQVGLLFGFIVAPMIMFGCAYYPWRLLDRVPLLQYAVLVNPLTYVAEGLRAVLTPDKPHMPLPAVLAALVVVTALFWRLGLRTFMKRAVG